MLQKATVYLTTQERWKRPIRRGFKPFREERSDLGGIFKTQEDAVPSLKGLTNQRDKETLTDTMTTLEGTAGLQGTRVQLPRGHVSTPQTPPPPLSSPSLTLIQRAG